MGLRPGALQEGSRGYDSTVICLPGPRNRSGGRGVPSVARLHGGLQRERKAEGLRHRSRSAASQTRAKNGQDVKLTAEASAAAGKPRPAAETTGPEVLSGSACSPPARPGHAHITRARARRARSFSARPLRPRPGGGAEGGSAKTAEVSCQGLRDAQALGRKGVYPRDPTCRD